MQKLHVSVALLRQQQQADCMAAEALRTVTWRMLCSLPGSTLWAVPYNNLPSIHVVLQALHVCIALLDRQQQQAGQVRGEGLRQSVERAAAASAELDSKLEADTIDGVCLHADRLAALLDASPETPELVSALPAFLTWNPRVC